MEKLAGKILLVDDDLDVLYTAKQVLKRHFEAVVTVSVPKKALQLLEKEGFEVVLLDMNFAPGITQGQEGLFWLRKMLKVTHAPSVILHTAYGDIELAVEGMKQGATDFLVKPWKPEKLLASVKNVWQLRQSEREVSRLKKSRNHLQQELDQQYPEMISEDPAMKPVFKMIEKVSRTDANVLILGENGTGKELVARAIHRQSKRAEEVFVKVDLGAIPESLFESELFGHAKGAFTDAKTDRVGRFEAATGGTLFLDEIGNLPLTLQAKLLTVLQNRQVLRVGSNKPLSLDVRLICATNAPIDDWVQSGNFRQDLLYRINTVAIVLPPLRERPKDIFLLLEYFLTLYSRKYQKSDMTISSSALKKLATYTWPGNIRELRHAVERAVILSETHVLELSDFPMEVRVTSQASDKSTLHIEDIEKQAIQNAIKACGGNLTQAAKELGMGRSTLYRKMEKYGL